MNRLELRTQLLELDLSDRPAEVSHRAAMVDLLDSTPDCFLRTSFPGHFTGSALVVSHDGRHALLHHHKKLDRWLQFGGHCDGDEDVLQVACREAREESGLTGLAVASRRPFDLDVHGIPPHGAEPGHWHYDVRYMLIAAPDAVPMVSDESHELQWMTPADIQSITSEPGLLRMVEKWVAILKRRGLHGDF